MVAARVQNVAVVRAEQNRKRPRKTVLHRLGAESAERLRPHRHQPNLLRAVIVPLQRAPAPRRRPHRSHVNNVGIIRLDSDVPALPRARRVAVSPRDRAFLRRARHRNARVVLLRAVNAVRQLIVHVQMVILPRQLIVDRAPRVAAVKADTGAAVVSVDHPLRVRRIDPQIMIVPVRGRNIFPILAAVNALPHLQIIDVDCVRVLGIRKDVHVIPRPVEQILVIGQLLPVRPAVIRTVNARLVPLRLDDRPHPPRLRRRDRHTNLPQDPLLRQAWVAADIRPTVPAVRRLPQPAVRAAADQFPEVTVYLPYRSIEYAGIVHIQRQVHRPRPLAHMQDALPGGASVSRPVHAALIVRPERMPQRRHIRHVGVARMDADLPNMVAVPQPYVLPRLTAVSGPVNPVPPAYIQPDRRLTRPRIDDIRVRLRYRQRAHRRHSKLPVRYILPVLPAVNRLPDPAGHPAKIENILIGRMSRRRHHAAAARRSNTTKLECVPRRQFVLHLELSLFSVPSIWKSRNPTGSALLILAPLGSWRAPSRKRQSDPSRIPVR